MALANEIAVDAPRRRRRRVALVLALASALLGSVFVANWFLNGKSEETAWTTDTVFPKPTRNMTRPHGVTVPISKPVVHTGQGGPEDPGAYIEEAGDGWLLENGQSPIDGLVRTGFTLPNHKPVPGVGFGLAFGGGTGAGGGGGGGEGSVELSCEKDASAIEMLTGKKCAETGSQPLPAETPETPGLTILPVVSSPAPAGVFPIDTGKTYGGEGPNDDPVGENGSGAPAVSVVPEPQNWAMMIAGFFLVGMTIRSGRGRRTRRTVAVVR